MKVFLVTKGDFDINCILGVCSTKEKALEFIDTAKQLGVVPDINSIPDEVEVDDLDKYLILLKEGYKQYHLKMQKDGSYKVELEKCFHFVNSSFHLRGTKDTRLLYSIIWAKSIEEAAELTNDKRLKLLKVGVW